MGKLPDPSAPKKSTAGPQESTTPPLEAQRNDSRCNRTGFTRRFFHPRQRVSTWWTMHEPRPGHLEVRARCTVARRTSTSRRVVRAMCRCDRSCGTSGSTSTRARPIVVLCASTRARTSTQCQRGSRVESAGLPKGRRHGEEGSRESVARGDDADQLASGGGRVEAADDGPLADDDQGWLSAQGREIALGVRQPSVVEELRLPLLV